MKKTKYKIENKEEKGLLETIEKREDVEALRIKRYISMPDLSRKELSPLKEVVERAKNTETLKDFDEIEISEIVPADISFDLFNFPENHPARSKSDTYYIDEKNILRTHCTVMWYYYLHLPEIREKLEKGEELGVISFGKVYRKDEIDRRHMNVFHQIDGLYLCQKSEHIINQDDLKKVLAEVAQGIFGKDVKYRFNPDTFPYTHSSLEMEVDKNSISKNGEKEEWVEILGAGIVEPKVLEKFGIDSEKYNGWAFGFGLERLAIISMELPDIRLLWSEDERVLKQLKLGQKFVEVSKYPAIVRDISFVVDNDFVPNNYFDLVRQTLGDVAEEVELLDKYENEEKFGKNKISYAYRITYRSLDRTLTNAEIEVLHKKLEDITKNTFNATIR